VGVSVGVVDNGDSDGVAPTSRPLHHSEEGHALGERWAGREVRVRGSQ
jgi:hypothetical protein